MSRTIVAPEAQAGTDTRRTFLSFYVAENEYGIDILKLRKIVSMVQITAVPRAPACIRGVMNLCGTVIPVVDLGVKLGLQRIEPTQRTCIIVAQTQPGAEMGLLVERVGEVSDIVLRDIEDARVLREGVRTDYLIGIARSNGHVKRLLDLDKMLSAREIQ